jgi:hypothetical protein
MQTQFVKDVNHNSQPKTQQEGPAGRALALTTRCCSLLVRAGLVQSSLTTPPLVGLVFSQLPRRLFPARCRLRRPRG